MNTDFLSFGKGSSWAAADHVLRNQAHQEIRNNPPKAPNANIAFEREMKPAEVLKGLADEVGPGAKVYSESLGVTILPEGAGVAEEKGHKARCDRNRENARENLFGGENSIYSNAESLRYLTVISADNTKAVTLSYQIVDAGAVAPGHGITSTEVTKTVHTGDACAKLQKFFDNQPEVSSADLGQVVDAVVEKQITTAGRPNFPTAMTSAEFDGALEKARGSLVAAKERLLPCASEEARARLSDPSHALNQLAGGWELKDGRATRALKSNELQQRIDQIRGNQGQPETGWRGGKQGVWGMAGVGKTAVGVAYLRRGTKDVGERPTSGGRSGVDV